MRDVFEVFRPVDEQIGAFGGLLGQQPVSVLIQPALSGAGGVAELDWHVGGKSEGFVGGHFGALVPGQRASHVLPRGGHGLDESVADGFCRVVIWQVDGHHVAGGAFDQGRDRRLVVRAGDEVPVSGNGTPSGRDE